jgi:hypothetical protein
MYSKKIISSYVEHVASQFIARVHERKINLGFDLDSKDLG